MPRGTSESSESSGTGEPTVTVLAEDVATVPATVVGERVVVAPEDLRSAIGWVREPEGLCRGDICVPVRHDVELDVDGGLDLLAVAEVLDRPAVLDADSATVALGLLRHERRSGLTSGVAPAFTLPDLDGTPHELEEWSGRRRMLVAFASW